jgi:hypothetical protein
VNEISDQPTLGRALGHPQKALGKESSARSASDARYGFAMVNVAAVFAVSRILIIVSIPITGDEAYHWEWATRLDWGYYDHPPMVALLIRISTELLGTDLLSVRLPALICALVVAACAWTLAVGASGSRRVAFWAVTALLCTPLMQILGGLMTTDPPFAAFFMLSAITMIRALNSGRIIDWLLFGAMAGCALQSKLIGLAIPIALAGTFAVWPANRIWFRRAGPYLAMAVMVAVWTPNLIWNAQHDWAMFSFHTGLRHDPKPFPTHLVQYAIGQPLLLLPILWVGTIGFLIGVWRRSFRNGTEAALFAFTAPLLVIGLVLSFRLEVGIHWVGASYVTGLPLVASDWLGSGKSWVRKAFAWGWTTSLFAVLLLQFALTRPGLTLKIAGLGAGQFRPFANVKTTGSLRELYGWNELGGMLNYRLSNAKSNPPLILCASYGTCAMTRFSTPGFPIVRHFSKPRRFGRMYRFWQGAENWTGRDAIFFSDRELSPQQTTELNSAFESVSEQPSIEVVVEGAVVQEWRFWECRKMLKNPYQAYFDNPLLP